VLACCPQVTSPDALVSYPHLVHQHGLLVSTLGLRFTVTSSHFVDGSMTVRCVASVSPILWQGDRESVVQRVSPLMEKNIREALLLGTPTAPCASRPLLSSSLGGDVRERPLRGSRSLLRFVVSPECNF
jgi:hypothetical protein